MGNFSERIIVPTINELIETNKLFIVETGGVFFPPDNLINFSSLEWALDIIQCPFIFGENPYPRLSDKAALLSWTIINNHVFYDGNKRTGMATIRILILNNGYQFNATNDEITQMARCIANYRESKITKTDLSTWIEEKIEQ